MKSLPATFVLDSHPTPLVCKKPPYLRRDLPVAPAGLECYWCDAVPTVIVEDYYFCQPHGANALAESMTYWMKNHNHS